jgi:multidrug efflux pump subunit AcrA (membrane-fusion protein)
MKIPAEAKPAAWGAVGGAIVLAIVGFTWGGWVTGGSSEQAAKQSAQTAVVAALAPICVVQFSGQMDAAGKLTELKALSSYDRGGFVEKGGWATMPGSDAPFKGVGDSCAKLLTAGA